MQKPTFSSLISLAQVLSGITKQRPQGFKNCLLCDGNTFPATLNSRASVKAPMGMEHHWIFPDYCFMCIVNF